MRVPCFAGGGRIAYAEVAEFHRTFACHVDGLIEALERVGPQPIHARAGRRVLALAHATIRSFQTGRRVEVT
jgi:myo-inositol 2-dehydrogenase / D-chiro-inositol 1-dehydrogenase